MKTIYRHYKGLFRKVAALGLAAAVLAGCLKEDVAIKPDPDDNDAMVTFSIHVPGNDVPSTRALTDAQECRVKTVDILAFDGNDFLYHVSVAESDITQSADKSSFAVSLLKSATPVRFVFLANAADIILAAYGASPITGSHTYASVQTALVKQLNTRWNADLAGNGSYDALPMWGEKNFAVTGSAMIDDIDLFRMVARINLSSVAEDFELEQVWLYNPMDRGLLIPAVANWNATDGKAMAASLGTGAAWNRTGNKYLYDDIANTGTDKYECLQQIYTFETTPGDRADNSKNTFLVVGGSYKGGARSYYRIDFALENPFNPGTYNYQPILRNHKYDFTITAIEHQGAASPDLAATERPINTVELLIQDEYLYRYYSYNGQYYLAAEDETIWYWWDETTGAINIKSDYTSWTATLSTDKDDPNAGVPGWITPGWSGSQTGAVTLPYTMTDNPSLTQDRAAYLHLKAGVLSLTVTIMQEKKFDLSAITITPFRYGYVGAFWRAEQTGERLIRIPYSTNGDDIAGDWTATVVAGRDWIILDPYLSYDTGIEWMGGSYPDDMNNHDVTYQVAGESRRLFGTCGKGAGDMIYFRIGLTSSYTATPAAPARYGIVEIKYNDNSKTSLIFVRQGHDPDYLMRKTDPTGPASSWSSPTRLRAVRYSPYNLTSNLYYSTAGAGRAYGGTALGDHAVARGNSSYTVVFTDYPSQAGSTFKWGIRDVTGQYFIHAFHPSNPSGSPGITDWNRDATYNGNWDGINKNNELCPSGYKRPNDGSVMMDVPDPEVVYSEQRQSLWLNPQDGKGSDNSNMLWGYYADGFFDRREIITPTQSTGYFESHSSAGFDAYWAAYAGCLFYNPNPDSYASLFFPAGGSRNNSGGLVANGAQARYWTTCITGTANSSSVQEAWGLDVGRDGAGNDFFAKNLGLAIRCVVDDNSPPD